MQRHISYRGDIMNKERAEELLIELRGMGYHAWMFKSNSDVWTIKVHGKGGY